MKKSIKKNKKEYNFFVDLHVQEKRGNIKPLNDLPFTEQEIQFFNNAMLKNEHIDSDTTEKELIFSSELNRTTITKNEKFIHIVECLNAYSIFGKREVNHYIINL